MSTRPAPARGAHARAAGPVDLWLAELDRAPEELDPLRASLSAEERERAARLRFDGDRERWIARRGTLRTLLSAYLECPPDAVELGSGPRGKPIATVGGVPAPLHFSLAASDGAALYAVARDRPVGVDLERRREDIDIDAVARRAFGAEAAARLAALPPAERAAELLRRWTAAEAALKLTGEGLSGLDRPVAKRPPAVLTTLPVPSGYVAALATEEPVRVPVVRRWPTN